LGSTVRRFVPIASWLPHYERRWLSRDVIAGFTIWGLLIPEMIAYAGLAGLPPQAGLYTLLATLLLYAIFGTSRHLVVAGTSASAVLVFSAVTALHPHDSGHYLDLAAAVVTLAGTVLIVAGLCRLGFITQFLSRPVMAGFVFGLAIFVTVSQLPKLFGLAKGEGDTIRQLAHLIDHLGDASVATFVVGAAALGVLFVLERFAPRLPGGLVVLVLGITASTIFNLDGHGVATVGKIPTGLPSVAIPNVSLSELWVLIPSAIGMVLVIFSEALGAAENFAEKHRYRIDPNQEMIALGISNLGSGLLGGLAAGGSLSQTAVNEGAGARSEMSPIVASLLSVVTVVALTPLFANLPEAVLAALIIHAVSHLMKVLEMRDFHRIVPREFWLGMLTLGGVIVFDVLPGLIMGVGASLVLIIYRASRPHVSMLGEDASTPGAYVSIERHSDAVAIPETLIVRPDAPMFYANAQGVRDAIDAATQAPNGSVQTVILDLDANDDIDITTANTLNKLTESLERRGVRLVLAHVHLPTLAIARRSGLLDKIGDDHIFPNITAAIAWTRRNNKPQ
jgi:high affinity sulfate transporter 1